MKTSQSLAAEGGVPSAEPQTRGHLAIVTAIGGTDAAVDEARALDMARAFAEPLLKGRSLDSGEGAWSHAVEVAQILKSLGVSVYGPENGWTDSRTITTMILGIALTLCSFGKKLELLNQYCRCDYLRTIPFH